MSLCVPYSKVLSTSSTATAFTAKTPTTTKPTGDAVIDLADSANKWGFAHNVPSWLQLVPYATNGNNDTFDMRVYGWAKTDAATPVWVPVLLLDVSLIVGDIAATGLEADAFIVDSVTLNDGFASSPQWLHIQNHAEDLPASIVLHTLGSQLIEWDWDLAGGQEAVSMNCLVRPFTLE